MNDLNTQTQENHYRFIHITSHPFSHFHLKMKLLVYRTVNASRENKVALLKFVLLFIVGMLPKIAGPVLVYTAVFAGKNLMNNMTIFLQI